MQVREGVLRTTCCREAVMAAVVSRLCGYASVLRDRKMSATMPKMLSTIRMARIVKPNPAINPIAIASAHTVRVM